MKKKIPGDGVGAGAAREKKTQEPEQLGKKVRAETAKKLSGSPVLLYIFPSDKPLYYIIKTTSTSD